jgi:hypothetical protein
MRQRAWIILSGAAITVMVVGGLVLALVDFQAALVLAAALSGALVLTWLLSWVTARGALTKRAAITVVALVLLAGGIVAGLLYAVGGFVEQGDFSPLPTAISPIVLEPQDAEEGDLDTDTPEPETVVVARQLTVIVSPEAGSLRRFTVEPTLLVDVYRGFETYLGEERVALPVRSVQSQRLGFLVREAQVGTFFGAYPVTVNEEAFTIRPCQGGCPPITVELRDMPQGAFQDARPAADIERDTYVTTETLIWEVTRTTRPISFAFVPPPFNNLSGALAPLLGAATVNDWVIGVVGLLGGVAIMPLAQSFLQDWAEGKVFEAVRGKKGSGKGD